MNFNLKYNLKDFVVCPPYGQWEAIPEAIQRIVFYAHVRRPLGLSRVEAEDSVAAQLPVRSPVVEPIEEIVIDSDDLDVEFESHLQAVVQKAKWEAAADSDEAYVEFETHSEPSHTPCLKAESEILSPESDPTKCQYEAQWNGDPDDTRITDSQHWDLRVKKIKVESALEVEPKVDGPEARAEKSDRGKLRSESEPQQSEKTLYPPSHSPGIRPEPDGGTQLDRPETIDIQCQISDALPPGQQRAHPSDSRPGSPVVTAAAQQPNLGCGLHRRHHPQGYQCHLCQQIFDLESSLIAHQLMQKGSMPHQCQECQKRVCTRAGLDLHILTCHTKPYKCGDCEERFPSRAEVYRHRRSHAAATVTQSAGSVIKLSTCELCSEVVHTQEEHVQHLKLVHQASSHLCVLCPYVSVAGETLTKHVTRSHRIQAEELRSGGKRSIAEVASNDRDGVNVAGATDFATIELFKCASCNYKSNRASVLKRHHQIHHVNCNRGKFARKRKSIGGGILAHSSLE